MDALSYILDGLEAELALERELGVRSLEFDRSLLAPTETPSSQVTRTESPSSKVERPQAPTVREDSRLQTKDLRLAEERPSGVRDYVFLHDRPLSPAGVEMMAKIITALGQTAETTPIVIAPPLPSAKMYVVLGGFALKKFLPGVKGAPGQWVKDARGRDVLVTYSPEYILRFKTVTPAVKKIKQDMWLSLKGVQQRARSAQK